MTMHSKHIEEIWIYYKTVSRNSLFVVIASSLLCCFVRRKVDTSICTFFPLTCSGKHFLHQADFMSQLRSLSNDCAFTNADEVVKFLFLIHNSHKRVQDQLLKDVTKNSSLTDCLLSAR